MTVSELEILLSDYYKKRGFFRWFVDREEIVLLKAFIAQNKIMPEDFQFPFIDFLKFARSKNSTINSGIADGDHASAQIFRKWIDTPLIEESFLKLSSSN